MSRRDLPVVELDPERLRQDFEEVEALHAKARKRFENAQYFAVTYEQLCANPQDYGLALLRFLDLEPTELIPAVSRLDLRPLSESIGNFAALRSVFAATPWVRYFDEESQ